MKLLSSVLAIMMVTVTAIFAASYLMEDYSLAALLVLFAWAATIIALGQYAYKHRND